VFQVGDLSEPAKINNSDVIKRRATEIMLCSFLGEGVHLSARPLQFNFLFLIIAIKKRIHRAIIHGPGQA
jgi:hypothetical protein